ncbi:MAG: hypothetical protein KC619_21600 [Myxococcales bacterium]|nr:hypothetical protein [Myxococcales bacterium]
MPHVTLGAIDPQPTRVVAHPQALEAVVPTRVGHASSVPAAARIASRRDEARRGEASDLGSSACSKSQPGPTDWNGQRILVAVPDEDRPMARYATHQWERVALTDDVSRR